MRSFDIVIPKANSVHVLELRLKYLTKAVGENVDRYIGKCWARSNKKNLHI